MKRRIGLSGVATAALVLFQSPAARADACLAEPVNIPTNMVTSTFGKTRLLDHYSEPRIHWGVDFQARSPSNPKQGAQEKAVDNGTIIGAGFWGHGYGNRVALRRANGDIVTYNHMDSVAPQLKSGALVGFQSGGAAVGSTQVSVGDIIGVAGGTADHMDRYDLPIHLHLEYTTGYGGVKLRETNDGTNTTRSHYLRNALEYSCKTYPFAPGAGPVTQGTGGSAPTSNTVAGTSASSEAVPTSADQLFEAQVTQPTVTDKERYGFPDTPPYDSYDGLSEAQIADAEMLRRTLDTEWEVALTGWSQRGILAEIARMRGVKLWLDTKIADKYRRIEAMKALIVADKTNRDVKPLVDAAYAKAVGSTIRAKVNN